MILRHLSHVLDVNQDYTSFVEKVDENIPPLDGSDIAEVKSYWRKKQKLLYTYNHTTKELLPVADVDYHSAINNDNLIKFHGVVLDLTKRILRTDSLIVDAVLGQGEALDCWNMTMQGISHAKAQLENDKMQQALDILDSITDPLEKAEYYKKVFGECCSTPQTIVNP